jgi:hypothetical protein
MANRFWVGGNSTWDATAGTKWATTSGGAGGSAVPTAADDVFLDNGTGTGNVTISATAVARSLDCTGYTGLLTLNSAITLTLGTSTQPASKDIFKLVAGMTASFAANSTVSTSSVTTSTGNKITTAGFTLGNLTISSTSTGGFILQDALTIAGTLTLTRAAFDTNNQTLNIGQLSSNGTLTRTLTIGSSSITTTASGAGWNLSTTTGLTLTANTANITITGNSGIFNHAGTAGSGTSNYGGTITLSGASSQVFTAPGSTFVNVTRTGTTGIADNLNIGGDFTVTGTLNITGAGAATPVLVQSNTVGTVRTITAAGVSLSYAWFSDITGAGAATWSGTLLGDALGNSGITFQATATNYWVGGTGNWSDAASHWANTDNGTAGTGRMPLPQDDGVVNGNSGGGTISMQTTVRQVCRNLDFTGSSTGLSSQNHTFYGNLNMGTRTIAAAGTFTFVGRGSQTISAASTTNANGFTISSFGGTYTLQSDLQTTRAVSTALQVTSGTFDANNYNVTLRANSTGFTQSGGTVNMGSGTWAINNLTNSGVNNFSVTGGTINCQTSTISFGGSPAQGAGSVTFAGGNNTYNDVTFAVDRLCTMTGSNTFRNFTKTSTSGAQLQLVAGTTQTFTGTLTLAGTSGTLMPVLSATGGSQFHFSKTSGVVSADYLQLQDSDATGGASWYAGANSTNVSNNTGWVFTAPPASASGGTLLLMGV